MNCGGVIASAPPRTRRSRFCTCSAAMSRRMVASDEVGQLDQLLHRHDGLFLDGGQDDAGGVLSRAWFLPSGRSLIHRQIAQLSINFNQNLALCSAT